MSGTTQVSITNTTKGRLPRLPFADMKNAILGKNFELSVAIVGTKRSQRLNKSYRGKDAPTDILSFLLDKNSGELIINPEMTKKKARLHNRSFENFMRLLVIHGMLHLKGFSHGSKMEREEAKFQKQFGI